MMNITVSDDYQDCVRYLNCFSKLQQHAVQVFNDNTKDLTDLAARFASAHALVLTRDRTVISEALLRRLPRLRLISQTGRIGEHIDLQACTERGVAVADTQGDGSSTAELTWALILAGRRHIVSEANRLRDGLWQGYVGQQLRGQRLGIWGYGRIGRQVANYGKAFGMTICVWGSQASRKQALQDGHEAAASCEAFFAESDIVTLHLRLSTQTRGLIRRGDLQLMKSSALLVNTSRAELIEPRGLERALRQGRPGAAAVDVFEEEPVLGARHPLLTLPNVLCTPHIGFVERDNLERYYGDAFDNILRFAAGDYGHLLNPSVMDHERQAGYVI